MKMNLILAALAVGAAALIPSCAPLPSTTLVLPRLQGTVVDAHTGRPIAAASVTAARAGYTRRAMTLASGHFTLQPASQWHYLAYIGSPGVAPVPWYLQGIPTSMTITASAAGYQSTSQTFHTREHNFFVLKLPDTIQIPLRR
jgi:hypothetical protein